MTLSSKVHTVGILWSPSLEISESERGLKCQGRVSPSGHGAHLHSALLAGQSSLCGGRPVWVCPCAEGCGSQLFTDPGVRCTDLERAGPDQKGPFLQGKAAACCGLRTAGPGCWVRDATRQRDQARAAEETRTSPVAV